MKGQVIQTIERRKRGSNGPLPRRAKCELCGFKFKPVLCWHHVLPVSENGKESKDNMVVLCWNCHRLVHHYYREYSEFHPTTIYRILSHGIATQDNIYVLSEKACAALQMAVNSRKQKS